MNITCYSVGYLWSTNDECSVYLCISSVGLSIFSRISKIFQGNPNLQFRHLLMQWSFELDMFRCNQNLLAWFPALIITYRDQYTIRLNPREWNSKQCRWMEGIIEKIVNKILNKKSGSFGSFWFIHASFASFFHIFCLRTVMSGSLIRLLQLVWVFMASLKRLR